MRRQIRFKSALLSVCLVVLGVQVAVWGCGAGAPSMSMSGGAAPPMASQPQKPMGNAMPAPAMEAQAKTSAVGGDGAEAGGSFGGLGGDAPVNPGAEDVEMAQPATPAAPVVPPADPATTVEAKPDSQPPEKPADTSTADANANANQTPEPPPPDVKKEPPPLPPACDVGGLQSTDLFLSADDSNSQASARVSARLIEDGRFVPGYAVRTYEFLNYHDIGYLHTDRVQVVPQARAVEGRQRAYTMQIGVVGPAATAREPLHLTFLIDVSGSMAGDSIARARDVVQAIASNLRAGDLVNVVVFNNTAQVVLSAHEIKGANDPTLLAAVSELRPTNRTDLHAALTTAYDLALRQQDKVRLNRVILISDGNTNTGAQSVELISQHAQAAEAKAVYLAGVAVGAAHGLNYQLMDKVTDAGRGAFVYIDSAEEAQKVFGEKFLAALDVAALDVRVKLVLPPGFMVEVFHGEQISTVASEVVPQHLSPNDSMVYHQVLTTCADPTGKEVFVVEAEYRDPKTGEARVERTERTLADMLAETSPPLIKGDAIVAYAEMLKDADELRQARPEEALATCQEALDAVKSGAAALPNDGELAEVVRLTQRYCGTLKEGEMLNGVCDCSGEPDVYRALGLCRDEGTGQAVLAPAGGDGFLAPDGWPMNVRPITRLKEAGPSLSPREGCQMLALSTGAVGEAVVIPGMSFGGGYSDPMPEYNGTQPFGRPDGANINDLTTAQLTLTAPPWARSFSFDFVYFSGEFPQYVGSQFNDTFYATVRMDSANGGAPTNVSFDGNGRSIEINNNYFQNEYHPCYEYGSGFDMQGGGGSTCWLQTSWPVQGGETFTLTFSIHDEGDAVYSSTVLLDHFQWHKHEAVGATDPVN